MAWSLTEHRDNSTFTFKQISANSREATGNIRFTLMIFTTLFRKTFVPTDQVFHWTGMAPYQNFGTTFRWHPQYETKPSFRTGNTLPHAWPKNYQRSGHPWYWTRRYLFSCAWRHRSCYKNILSVVPNYVTPSHSIQKLPCQFIDSLTVSLALWRVFIRLNRSFIACNGRNVNSNDKRYQSSEATLEDGISGANFFWNWILYTKTF